MATEFDTLDEVVLTTFPGEFTRVVAVREHGDVAVALFNTRPQGEPYLYQVHYRREHGRWFEGSSSNGCGWHRYSRDAELGVTTFWDDDAPPGAERVRGELDGDVREDAVSNGIYLLVWWDIPEAPFAQVRGFRVKGEWVRAPSMWEQFQTQREAWRRSRDS